MTADRVLRTMDDLPLDGKQVLVRVDFNVSVGDDGLVDASEDYRIESALDTIQELMQRRCKVILLTHRGRPQENWGDTDLKPIHARLEKLLGEPIKQAAKLFGPEVEAVVAGLEPGGVVLLPNVRTNDQEVAGNMRFAKQLSEVADVYVSECFSVTHRAHTSVAFVPQVLAACAGRRTALEIEQLTKLRHKPERPYVALTSGAKIKTKVGLLHDLLRNVDTICLGGQVANVFLAAQGLYTEHSYNADDIAAAQHLWETDKDKFLLPSDVVVGTLEGKEVQTVSVDAIPPGSRLLDIGPQSVARFVAACQEAKTIMWNGPMGMFEVPVYAKATQALASALADLPAHRVVGGGDTMIAIEQQNAVQKYDHVSVGGGAMIAFLEGKRMPGLEPLYD